MPKKIINTAVMKKILFAPIKNSLEKSFIFLTDKIFDKFLTKSIIGPVIKNADIPSKYKPLVGSFANEWTLSIIPDLTMKAPNKLSVNARIDKNIVHAIRFFDLEET